MNNSGSKEEVWTILKTPPKTKKELDHEFWINEFLEACKIIYPDEQIKDK